MKTTMRTHALPVVASSTVDVEVKTWYENAVIKNTILELCSARKRPWNKNSTYPHNSIAYGRPYTVARAFVPNADPVVFVRNSTCNVD